MIGLNFFWKWPKALYNKKTCCKVTVWVFHYYTCSSGMCLYKGILMLPCLWDITHYFIHLKWDLSFPTYNKSSAEYLGCEIESQIGHRFFQLIAKKVTVISGNRLSPLGEKLVCGMQSICLWWPLCQYWYE